MSETSDALVDQLDKLGDRIVAAFERGAGTGGGGGAAPEPPKPAPGDPAPEPEPEPETVHYSRGRDKHDAYPEQRTAASFEAFAAAVLADRSTAKGLPWISGPFARNDDGRHRRCQAGALPRGFIAFDLDGATPEAFVDLSMWLGAYSGFGYTTSSHTAESPHARYILELSRQVSRTEDIRLGEAMQREIEKKFGRDNVKLDPSVYRAEQPIFTPLQNADAMRYQGDPVDVDAMLALAPKEEPRTRWTNESDPYRAALLDQGLVLRELGPGKDAITCPFQEDHTEASSDTATVYFWPRHGGYQWGGIHCLHAHCADRNKDQRLYIEKLGLAPRKVWREQGAGAASRDELPPLEAYDDAAQEARASTAGGGAPGGGSPADCESRVILLRGDALRVEPIRWQWDGWLARSKLHILAGPPGAGKSAIALRWGLW